MPTKRPPPSGDSFSLPTFELHWEQHEPGDDLFPNGIDEDETLLFHGTPSTREEAIDREGLHPSASGVALAEVRSLIGCFDLLGWSGTSTSGCPVLRAFTIRNDFRDGEDSPLYLSDRPSQAIYFGIRSAAGGEKLSACRWAIGDLRRMLNDVSFRETQQKNPAQWTPPGAASEVSSERLAEVTVKLSKLAHLERAAHDEFDRWRYTVIYALRPPTEIRATWEDCKGMGIRVFDSIPPSWFVAKLRIYPPTKK